MSALTLWVVPAARQVRQLCLFSCLFCAPMTAAEAQTAPEPPCDLPRGRGDYIACALKAGNVADLRDAPMRDGERELRFWSVSGNMTPERVLVVRQHNDTTSGQLLLIWRAPALPDSFVNSVCAERWSNPVAMLCAGRLRATPDWGALLAEIDGFGVQRLPAQPVGETRCDRTPVPALPGRLPVDRICAVMADGFRSSIEYRTRSVYWRYSFAAIPDTASPDLRRDAAIRHLLDCVARDVRDGPCRP